MRMNLLFAETLRKLRIEKGRVSALTQSPTPFCLHPMPSPSRLQRLL